MGKTTAIIMVTYNGWDLTRNCLKDLSPLLSTGDYVIAIADNGSSDGTVENIRKEFSPEAFPQIHVYPQAKNLGFGAANNAALRGLIADQVEFDTVCLLNNDTRFDAKAIIELRKELDNVQDALAKDAVLAPTTYNADGSVQSNFFAGLGPYKIGFLQFLMNAFRNEKNAARILEGTPRSCADDAGANCDGIFETCWTSAVCWMMSADLWNRVGGFDENIFMYYEDADMALRCRELGARFFITRKSAITHLGGGSAKSSLSRALQHDRSQQYVFRKHFGIKGLFLSKGFRTLRSLVRILATLPHAIFGKADSEKRNYIRHHFALLKEAFL